MTDAWIIGTAADCPLRVEDEYASAYHAVITRDESGQVWLRDLGSTNGTYVRRGGSPIPVQVPLGSAYPLSLGDVIRIGRTWIPVRDERVA